MRTYKRKTKRASHSKELLVTALKAVRDKESNVNKASAKYGIPVSTLRHRVKKLLNSWDDVDNIDVRLGNFRPTFSDDQETELMEHAYEMEKIFFGFSMNDMQRLAFQYAERNNLPHKFNKIKKLASREWLNKFLAKHPELVLKARDEVFPKGDEFTCSIKDQFFDLLYPLMNEYSFAPSRIYTEDQVAFTFMPNMKSKVINQEKYRKLGASSTGGHGKTVTAAVCCNAAGDFILPLIIFPRNKYNAKLEKDSPPDSCIVFEPSGWMQPDIFFPIWFNHFIEISKPTKDDPVLLILNGGAKFTKNLNLLYAARENYVHLLFIPPHTSHKLQPITRGFVEPFSFIYSTESEKWMKEHQGKSIKINDIAQVFRDSYQQAAISANAINGFKSTGIYPLNRDIFSEDEFCPEKESEKDCNHEMQNQDHFQKITKNEITPFQRAKAVEIIANIESQLAELKKILFSNDNNEGPSHSSDKEGAYSSDDTQSIEVPQSEELFVKTEIDPFE